MSATAPDNYKSKLRKASKSTVPKSVVAETAKPAKETIDAAVATEEACNIETTTTSLDKDKTIAAAEKETETVESASASVSAKETNKPESTETTDASTSSQVYIHDKAQDSKSNTEKDNTDEDKGACPKWVLVQRAMLANVADRYDEMAQFMKSAAETREPLTKYEQNLFWLAYKNCADLRRTSWTALQSHRHKLIAECSPHLPALDKYIKEIELELRNLCTEALETLDACVVPAVIMPDDIVFLLKIRGDLHRYIARITRNEARIALAEKALKTYQQGYEIACIQLRPTHPSRLGLVLSFAVFYTDIMHDAMRAVQLIQSSHDDAVIELNSENGAEYEETVAMMQRLREFKEWLFQR